MHRALGGLLGSGRHLRRRSDGLRLGGRLRLRLRLGLRAKHAEEGRRAHGIFLDTADRIEGFVYDVCVFSRPSSSKSGCTDTGRWALIGTLHMLDAAVEKTLAQLAQPAPPSARTERTVGDPIRALRAVLAEQECALSPPPGRWAAQAPDTHHATLMYFVGLWALHGARAAGPKKGRVFLISR